MPDVSKGVWFENQEAVANAIKDLSSDSDGTTVAGDLAITGVLTVPANTNTNWRTTAAGVFQLKNTTTGLFHDLYITGADGSPVLNLATNGEA
jgi:hypothetical protein